MKAGGPQDSPRVLTSWLYAFMQICTYVRVNVYDMSVGMYVCVCVCMYICMCVCVCV